MYLVGPLVLLRDGDRLWFRRFGPAQYREREACPQDCYRDDSAIGGAHRTLLWNESGSLDDGLLSSTAGRRPSNAT
jgi:hypothetical protein